MSVRITAQIKDFLDAFAGWASAQPDVRAVALIGSYAREAASVASDIDLVMLVDDPGKYIDNMDWLGQFGAIDRQQVEDYGMVTSLRVWYIDGCEVEYGLTTPDWVRLPLDEGTQRVIRDGMRVIFEREALLSPHL